MNLFVELNCAPHRALWIKQSLDAVIRKTRAAESPVALVSTETVHSTLRWYSDPMPANDARKILYGIWRALDTARIDPKHFRIETVVGGWPCVDDDDDAVPF